MAPNGWRWEVGGTILVSGDAAHWAAVPKAVPGNPSLYAVGFAANRWVAVGAGGTIVASTNAVNWTVCPSGTTETFQAVCFGNGRFLTVGTRGAIASSTNGVDWHLETVPSSFSPSYEGWCVGKGIFVASGLGGIIQTSADGTAWAETFSAGHDIHSVFFDGNRFLAGRFNGLVYASDDGTNWAFTGGISGPYIYEFAKYNGAWFCTGGELWRSTDLTNWTQIATGAFSSSSGGGTYAVNAGESGLLITGEKGNVLVSADGTNFVQGRHGRPLPVACAVRHGNRFVAPTITTDRLVLTSDDGWNWFERPFGATANQVVSDGQRVVAVGTRGSFDDISVSNDGIVVGRPFLFEAAAVCMGLHAAAWVSLLSGGGGVVYLSANGESWISNSIAGMPALKGVAADGDGIAAVGPGGTNYVSQDGVEWAPSASSTTNQLLSVAFGAGKFVAGGARGTIARSDDGANWQSMSLGSSLTIKRIIFAEDKFVAVTTANTYTSPDARHGPARRMPRPI